MNLPRFSVRNPVAINLLMLVIIGGGLLAMANLVREFFPISAAEQVVITVAYPGATPDEIERSVARPIEREIEDVDGVDEIRSTVYEGITLIVVEMEDGADRDRVVRDLRSELDKATPDLPDGTEEPELTESRPYIPAIAIVIHGDASERQLRDAVDAVRDDLLDLEGITELVITGIRKREFHVTPDADALEAHGLTIADVGQALRTANQDVPGGQLEGRTSNVRVRTIGERRVARDLEQIVVRSDTSGALLRVGDIATVSETFEDKVERGVFRGRRAASINVFKAPEQDAIKIAKAVRRYVRDSPTLLGGALQLETTTDLSRIIEGRLDLLSRNALMGLVLVLLTLAIFLETRIALWVAIGLSVSFIGTFLVLWLVGGSINLINMFGMIVVLGLIVDDAIVIGENIFRRQRDGTEPHRAAVEGASEVALPVVAAVLTTMAAFLPLMFMPGRIGTFLGVLPVVVIIALALSLVEGFLILPSHLAHAKPPREPRTALGRGLRAFHRKRHHLFETVLPGMLGKVLAVCLRWRYVVIAGAIASLMLAFGMVAGGHVPFVLLGNTDAETITVKLEMAAGTPEETTVAMLKRIEIEAGREPEVRSTFAVLGASFSDRGRETPSDPAVVGQVNIELQPAEIRGAKGQRTSVTLVSALRARTQSLPGVRRLSYTSQSGGPGGPDIEVRLRGDDLPSLAKAVGHVRKALASFDGVEEIYDDLELGKLEAHLRLREDAHLLGLTTVDLARQMRDALFGFEVQDLQIDEDEVTVRVLLPERERETLADLGTIRVRTPAGARVPLEEVATIDMQRGYASIVRVDGKRTLSVRAQVDAESGANVNEITKALAARDLATLPERFEGVSWSLEGAQQQTRESVGALPLLFGIAMILIFCIIAVLFRSYAQPLVVMSVIPFAMLGAIGGHWIMGYPFTILSMIGVVALAGIVVNDGLILVDLANRLRREGGEVVQSVLDASKGRMRAILLTSITTCVGLAPLMLETSFQAQFLIPMAVSIVFGLIFGTVLVLLLLPCLYLAFEDVRAGLRYLLTGRWHRELPYDPATALD